MRVERSFRGISVRLALGYLESIGGEVTDGVTTETDVEGKAEGEGWSAELFTEMVAIGPSIELTEVSVVFEGEEAVLDEVIPAFEQKAVRSGG